MKKPLILALLAAFILLSAVTIFGVVTVARSLAPKRTDRKLLAGETATVRAAVARMRQATLADEAARAETLATAGLWRAATGSDPYLKQAEASDGTPFAYTLADGRKVQAVVLAPRFFTETTPNGRAALMIHELGHVKAYQSIGKSDEFDGYKLQYDTHTKLGLGERDSLVYFSMLDGVVEYVAPRLPTYKSRPDVKDFLAQTSGE